MSSAAASAPMSSLPDDAARAFRWNTGWFITDYVAFSVGMAFISQATVLPTFVSQITDSTLWIGMIATIQSGAWLIPQIFVAVLVAPLARKRTFMLVAAAIGRPAYLILAALCVAIGDRDPALLLAALFGLMLVFGVSDGFVSVPWFDIFCRAIPASRRGRVLGSAQVVSGVLGIAVGGVVALVLANPTLTFPTNFAVLFALAGLVFVLDLVALAFIREPAPVEIAPANRQREGIFDRFMPVLRNDKRFLRAVSVRLLFGIGAMVFPFYIVYAVRQLGFSSAEVGLFLSAQVLGGVIGGILFGQIGDHLGTRTTIRTAIAISALAPLLGLLAGHFGDALGPALLYVMALVFVAIGMTFSSYMLGFMNYVLELAPTGATATYIGLYNAIVGSIVIVPPLVGWLLQVTSYTTVFALALSFFTLAMVASIALPEPRHSAAS